VQYGDQERHLAVSSDAIERFLDSFERTSAIFVDWASHQPVEFGACVALIAFWLFLRYRSRIETARMRIAYEERRSSSQIPELPLPLPPERHKAALLPGNSSGDQE
jgi:hypothetical protein